MEKTIDQTLITNVNEIDYENNRLMMKIMDCIAQSVSKTRKY